WSGMVRGFDHGLELLGRVEGHHAPGGDRNLLAGLRIAAGPLRLLPQLEVAEAGQLDAVAGLERDADLLEKALDHVLGFPLVEPELLEQQVGEFGFGEGHVASSVRSVAPKRAASVSIIPRSVDSMSASVKVRAVSCI